MTAKEKATELIEKFKDKVNPYIGSGMLSNTHDDSAILWQSKKCVQIVCDECLKEHCHESEHKDPKAQDRWIEFWQDVKREVDAL